MEKQADDYGDTAESSCGNTKFARLFFSAGISGNPVPVLKAKKLTHVITHLFVFKGSVTNIMSALDEKGDSEFLQTMRFMNLN